MKYKVVFICYLRRNGAQRQKAFISKATENVRISFENKEYGLDEKIQMPLVSVEFFETKKEAVKEANHFCYQEDIYML